MPSQKLRLGGKGATSMFRATFWFPKLLTSGSRPVYLVHVMRLRPLKLISAERAWLQTRFTIVSGSVYESVNSRSFAKDASSTYTAVCLGQSRSRFAPFVVCRLPTVIGSA